MSRKEEEVWVCPDDDISNRSIADAVQAGEEDFAFGVEVDGKPHNLIRVASASVLGELRAARANGTIGFREVRKASPGSPKRDVTFFTTSSARSRRHSRRQTAQDLVAAGVIRDPAGILSRAKNGPRARVRS